MSRVPHLRRVSYAGCSLKGVPEMERIGLKSGPICALHCGSVTWGQKFVTGAQGALCSG